MRFYLLPYTLDSTSLSRRLWLNQNRAGTPCVLLILLCEVSIHQENRLLDQGWLVRFWSRLAVFLHLLSNAGDLSDLLPDPAHVKKFNTVLVSVHCARLCIYLYRTSHFSTIPGAMRMGGLCVWVIPFGLQLEVSTVEKPRCFCGLIIAKASCNIVTSPSVTSVIGFPTRLSARPPRMSLPVRPCVSILGSRVSGYA